VLIKEQYGFRPGKSTITSSVVFINYISYCLESGYQVEPNHELLVVKLECLGLGYPLLNYMAFKFSIHHIPHDFTNIRQVLNTQTLSSHRNNADLEFLSGLLNCSLNVPDFFLAIPFRTQSYPSRTQSQFYIPAHRPSYGHNHIPHRMLRAANSV